MSEGYYQGMRKFDENGQRRQSKPQPADAERPFKAPDRRCNARLARQSGYCDNEAGDGTDHPGLGRCRLHGGLSPKQEHEDGPLGMFRAAGLEPLINLAETMTRGDSEYLTYVSNNGLVIMRAQIVARMHKADVSPKELADLTMALQRIDTLLAKYTEELNPEVAGADQFDHESAELERLRKIASGDAG